MICPHCNQEIAESIIRSRVASQIGARGGRVKSRAKTEACRRNARLGGRPKRERTMKEKNQRRTHWAGMMPRLSETIS
jgi:hypothetical protein